MQIPCSEAVLDAARASSRPRFPPPRLRHNPRGPRQPFAVGHRAFHIVDPAHRAEHLRRLGEAGIDVAAAEERGQLRVMRWEDAYLREGHFDQDRMLALIEEVLQEGKAKGFPLTRLVANMEWALEDRPGVDDIVEYETRLNYVLPKYDDAVC
jgi:hypothetical protein